jgi:hypothetical protein
LQQAVQAAQQQRQLQLQRAQQQINVPHAALLDAQVGAGDGSSST